VEPGVGVNPEPSLYNPVNEFVGNTLEPPTTGPTTIEPTSLDGTPTADAALPTITDTDPTTVDVTTPSSTESIGIGPRRFARPLKCRTVHGCATKP